ncbi:MAG TPA: chromate transporter [Chloroflexota bacterium]|nr:chromate transporter [Chloroflexota bacterium]
MEAPTIATRPPALGTLFLAFGKVGLLSFGGGSTTLVLMQQEVVDRRQWLTSRDFLLTMALSQMWPGVHLIAQSVLIGHRLRGLAGALACLLGMMVPATTVTILFTALFLVLRDNSLGQGAIAGILPATAGLAFAVAYRFGRAEVVGQPRAVGVLVVGLALTAFVLMAFVRVSSVVAVLGAGAVAILLFRRFGEADGSR